jgi:hypothetical protein
MFFNIYLTNKWNENIMCTFFPNRRRERKAKTSSLQTHTQQNIYTQNQHAFFSSFSSPRIQQLLHCKILSLSLSVYGVFSLTLSLWHTTHTLSHCTTFRFYFQLLVTNLVLAGTLFFTLSSISLIFFLFRFDFSHECS